MMSHTEQLAELNDRLVEVEVRLAALETKAESKEPSKVRDDFAAAALEALIPFKADNIDLAVKQAYEIADKMIEESANARESSEPESPRAPEGGTLESGTESPGV